MFLSAQELARMMRGAAALTGTGNLVIKYIESLEGTRKGARDVLLDAYNTRSLILVLDGLVRAPLFTMRCLVAKSDTGQL